MSKASTGNWAGCWDKKARTCCSGFFRKRFAPTGFLPSVKLVALKRKRTLWKPVLLFPFFPFAYLTLFLRNRHFPNALNWPCRAVSSTERLGADCFHTGRCSVPVFGFKKRKNLFFLALISLALNFLFFFPPPRRTQSCLYSLYFFDSSHSCLARGTQHRTSPRTPHPLESQIQLV